MSAVVMFRGRRACPCLAEWIPVYEAELKRVGEIRDKVDIAQLIGTYSKSGGTHVPGGAADLWQRSSKAIAIAEEMGAAAYGRTAAQGFAPHQHLVLKGCPHNAGGRYQVVAREAGYNGLGAGGRGGRDPRGKTTLRTYKQGIAWAKARQKPKPAPVQTRATDFEAATFNMKGGTSGFPTRVPVIRARIFQHLPHFVIAQELAPKARALVSTAIKTKYDMQSNYANKVQWLLRNRQGWKKVKSAKYQLGNNRHGHAVQYRHRHSGAEFVLANVHPSWQHDAGKLRAAEARKLVAGMNRDFGRLEKVVGGDFNSSHERTKSRPDDSFMDVLETAGFHDLFFDVPPSKRKGEQYNTAHQNKTPYLHSGIHLDRFAGTAGLEGREWTNDVHDGKRGGDHWMVRMAIRLTHPVK